MADFLLELWKAAALIAMALLAATPERAASADCRSSEGRTIEAIVVVCRTGGGVDDNSRSRESHSDELQSNEEARSLLAPCGWALFGDWIAEELELPAR